MRGTAAERRALWQAKPVLRELYADYHRRIARWCRPGRTIEIGSGIGTLADSLADVVTTDITLAPWLQAAADAQRLPFMTGAFDNLVAIDVLHHVQFPQLFFTEAARVVRPGGRIVLLEPAVTLGSYLFYRFLHEEDLDLGQDPLACGTPSPGRDPAAANQAIPTLVFGRYRRQFAAANPALAIRHLCHLSLLAFPLSGGFRRWSLVPSRVLPRLLRIEERLETALGCYLGFRLLAVLDRRFPDGAIAP